MSVHNVAFEHAFVHQKFLEQIFSKGLLDTNVEKKMNEVTGTLKLDESSIIKIIEFYLIERGYDIGKGQTTIVDDDEGLSLDTEAYALLTIEGLQ